MSISSAKATFGALIKRVEGGQDVVITRHGRPAAVLVDWRKYEGLKETIGGLAALSRGKARRYTVKELFK
jgi:prevent-host-death family protein